MIAIGEGFKLRDVKAHWIIYVSRDIHVLDDSAIIFHSAFDYIRSRGADLVIIHLGDEVQRLDTSAIATVTAYNGKIEDSDGRYARFRFCGNRKPILRVAHICGLVRELESDKRGIFSCVTCKDGKECRYRIEN